jgi:hypothetical protein
VASSQNYIAPKSYCPPAGDINIDDTVDYLAAWEVFQALSTASSWADTDLDGMTSDVDLSIILQNQGACRG